MITLTYALDLNCHFNCLSKVLLALRKIVFSNEKIYVNLIIDSFHHDNHKEYKLYSTGNWLNTQINHLESPVMMINLLTTNDFHCNEKISIHFVLFFVTKKIMIEDRLSLALSCNWFLLNFLLYHLHHGAEIIWILYSNCYQ